MKTAVWLLVLSVLIAMGPARALALINPNFTPIHLVKQSSLILELQFGSVQDGKATATVKRVVKGAYEAKTLVLTLSSSAFAEHAKSVEQLANSKDGIPGIFFAGEISGDEGGGGGEGGGQKAFLHVAGTWVSFSMSKANQWEMDRLAESMNTTWNGGTDMLVAATDYILADPDADVPVKEGIAWSSSTKFAQITGPVHTAQPVDLVGDGKLVLYVASEAGDHLFKYDTQTQSLADVTAASKLTAKSKVAAWADFNADGKLDLLSWDGDSLTLYTQNAEGAFQAGQPMLKGALADGCLALTCIDSGKPGHPAVLIGTRTAPLLWTPGEASSPTSVGGPFAGAALGTPGLCLVADFDNDGLPDILQLFEKGSLIYAGRAPGQFDAPKPCAVALGAGVSNAFLGDFDANGLLDVFAVAADSATHLWTNHGKFSFTNTMAMTGEMAYKGGSGAVGGATGDFNNDGRQDVMFWYGNAAPHLYFNRGFRTFGLANGIDPGSNGMLAAGEEGQQAGCFADLNGDGAQDMVLILKNGEAWVFYPEAGEGTARCARGTLAVKGPIVGPLTVTGYRGPRCLGAWNVQAGVSEAFVGVAEAGPVTLKWQFPAGQPQEKKVIVENKPVRVVLDPAR